MSGDRRKLYRALDGVLRHFERALWLYFAAAVLAVMGATVWESWQ